MASADKTMFEIYRDGQWNRRYHAVFYTDLEEHQRDKEIARAASGETLFTGFVRDDEKAAARREVEGILGDLNALDESESPSLSAIVARLQPYLAAHEG